MIKFENKTLILAPAMRRAGIGVKDFECGDLSTFLIGADGNSVLCADPDLLEKIPTDQLLAAKEIQFIWCPYAIKNAWSFPELLRMTTHLRELGVIPKIRTSIPEEALRYFKGGGSPAGMLLYKGGPNSGLVLQQEFDQTLLTFPFFSEVACKLQERIKATQEHIAKKQAEYEEARDRYAAENASVRASS